MNDNAFEGTLVKRAPRKERAPHQSSVLELLLRAAEEEGQTLDAETPVDIEGAINESLAAIVDHGALESLDDAVKRAFVAVAFAKLKPGGMYSLFHRSQHEDVGARRKTKEFLEALFPVGVEHLLDWNETHSTNKESGIQRFAWSTIVRKSGSTMSVMDLLDKAVALKHKEEGR